MGSSFLYTIVPRMFFRRFVNLVIFFLFSIFSSFSQVKEKAIMHFPVKGCDSNEVLKLTDDWQFYYGKHLSAKEMMQLKPEDKHFIKTPSNWKTLEMNGLKTPVFGNATFFMQIVVDTSLIPIPKSYGFRVGDITSAYSLYVNDARIMGVGNATTNTKDFMPGYYPHASYFNTTSDTLNVIIHASNFFYPHFSGISRVILFGQEETISRTNLLKTSFSIFLICIFAILFLFQLAVYIAHPKETAHLLVGLLSFLFLTKMLLDHEFTIFHFFPHFSFFVGYRIWMMSFMAVPLFLSLIGYSFPKEMNRKIILSVYFVYTIFALCMIVLPLPFLLNHLYIIVYISILCIIYMCWGLLLALVHRREYSITHFISSLIVLILSLYDLGIIANPNKITFLSHLGVCLYLIVQSIIILVRFIGAHKLSLELTKKLEETNLHLEVTVEERTLELQQTNRELERLNHQKDFLLTTTSHDLRNSFNLLINFSEILSDEAEIPNGRKKIIDAINDSARNGYQVLENILGWAKIQMTHPVEKAPIRDLTTLVDKEINFLRHLWINKGLTVRTELDDRLLFNCDEEQLKCIVRNMLSNAIKFSKNNGEIFVSNRLKEDVVEISIRDNGIGMSEEMAAFLFDYTIDNRRRGTSGETGSGLGLVIVKELTESNQGTITCLSQINKGTDFILRFPYVKE
jgi:signal transduction histidine kinase